MQCHLISWNLHGIPVLAGRSRRMRAAAAAILARAPDVVLLQEVWMAGDVKTVESLFTAAGFVMRQTPAAWFGRHKAGLLAFVRAAGWDASPARFVPFADEGPLWKIWEADALGDKGVLTFEVTRRDSGERVAVVDTHLQSQYGSRTYDAVRMAQARQIVDLVAGIDSSLPVLIAGDFNTTPDDPVYRAMTNAGWIDLTASLRSACRCGTAVNGERLWIDYVFARPSPEVDISASVQLIENRKADDPYSDHQGLDAQIAVRRRPSPFEIAAWLGAAAARGPLSRRAWMRAVMAPVCAMAGYDNRRPVCYRPGRCPRFSLHASRCGP